MPMDHDIALANRLADAAGDIIRPFFRGDWTHERKGDASPVTEADRAAEAAMRSILEQIAPDDGIIGEEFGPHRLQLAGNRQPFRLAASWRGRTCYPEPGEHLAHRLSLHVEQSTEGILTVRH